MYIEYDTSISHFTMWLHLHVIEVSQCNMQMQMKQVESAEAKQVDNDSMNFIRDTLRPIGTKFSVRLKLCTD